MTRYILTSTLRHGGELPSCYTVHYIGNEPDTRPNITEFKNIEFSCNNLGLDIPEKVVVGFQTRVQLEGNPLDAEDVPHGDVWVHTREEIVSIDAYFKSPQYNRIALKYNNKYIKKNDILFGFNLSNDDMKLNLIGCEVISGDDETAQIECEAWNRY